MPPIIPTVLRAARLAAVVSVALAPFIGAAKAGGPFEELAGVWSGNGTISMNDGHNERIRCKAVYDVVPSGIILHQNLRCASDSYKFEVRSSLQAEGAELSGTWTEVTRQATGKVSGSIRGDDITTSVQGTGFSANLNVTTHGNAQAVSISPEGTDIKAVRIDLRRS